MKKLSLGFTLGALALGTLSTFAAASMSAQALGGPYSYYAVAPCRAYDTRTAGPLPNGVIAVAEVRSFTIKGVCGVPTDAAAISGNFTVVQPTGAGDLRLAPEGSAFPLVSTSNYTYLENLANGAIVPLGPGTGTTTDIKVTAGMCCAAPPLQYHLLIDITGYFK